METIFEYQNTKSNTYAAAMAVKKLKRLQEKYPFVLKSYVFLKEENHAKEKRCICGIRLSVPGPLLYASSHSTNLISALHETIRNLKVQLNKRKATLYSSL